MRWPRFIPTNVGNTNISCPYRSAGAVHPHERGEYTRRIYSCCESAGSSPRTWGILLLPSHDGPGGRFIPTNVGNTYKLFCINLAQTVHPHERGEYNLSKKRQPTSNGSSPRTWGIHHLDQLQHHSRRFIPTNVGNTTRCRGLSFPETVHPHERGEYFPHANPAVWVIGSSPRTWGIPPSHPQNPTENRFIPTNVGNT